MKILIIDDHDLFAEGLKLLIKSLDTQADSTLASTYADGMKHLQHDSESTNFKLILLDYQLPDASAEETIPSICAEAGSTPVVVISSEDDREIIRQSIHAGAAGFVPKSSSKQELISALKLILNGGTFLPRQVLHSLKKDDTASNLNLLTKQQRRILSFVVKGTANKVIASKLDIAEGTVKAHLHNAYKLLGVNNRTEAVVAVAKHKIKF